MDEREHSRLKEFRQLKQEIRGSKEHLVVGIDVAKERHHAFFGTATGKTLYRRLIFANNREGFERLLIQAEAIRVQHRLQKVIFGLEPTADYHKALGEFLIKCGYLVVLVGGSAVKNNRQLLDGRWDKHDMKDSANVADLIAQGKCLFCEHPSPALRDLRGLLSFKRRLKKQEQGMRVRIRNHLLAQYFPEMDQYWGHHESANLAIVRWCLDPSVIAGMEYEQFVRLVSVGTVHRGQQNHVRVIWEQAADSIGCAAGTAVGFEAKTLVESLKQVRETIAATEAKIEEICGAFPEYPYLLSIPGFGPDVAAKVLAALGNPSRFNAGKEVLKMAGLDLSAERSGKRSDGVTPVISKKGKADLRYALYQAALVASIRNRHFIVSYTNKLKGREREKGIKTKMRVKLAAKLLIIAWTLMKKKELFNPEYLNKE
jgi:transposase